MIGDTPDIQELIDVETERIVDPDNQNMTLQLRTALSSHITPEDILHEATTGNTVPNACFQCIGR